MYSVQKKDNKKAGAVFASAFRSDPVWRAVFSKATDRQRQAFFQAPAQFCRTFGTLSAPSQNLEGMIGWVYSDNADMTILKGIRCGSFFACFGAGFNNLKDMGEIFSPLEKARKELMEGLEYIYVMILGIAPAYQKQGYGSALLSSVLSLSDKKQLPIYLETATENNVAWYGQFGFQVLEEVMHPIIEKPQWSLCRQPR